MKRPVIRSGVIVGTVNTSSEIVAASESLAISYAVARWRWNFPGGISKIPDASQIADTIRKLRHGLQPRDGSDWCMSGGMAVVLEAGSFHLEVAPSLAPDDDALPVTSSKTEGEA